MASNLSQSLITDCIENKPWDFANQILYDLCKNHPSHNEQNIVIAKTWLIGRTYAAALERFKKDDYDLIGDNFYEITVYEKFRDLDLDNRLTELSFNKRISRHNLLDSLIMHGFLTQKLYPITKHNNRSFCSKYLHFHLPEIFFIYDSRVNEALKRRKVRLPKDVVELIKEKKVDKEYAAFCLKCLDFISEIEAQYPVKISSSRQLDNILIKLNEENQKSPLPGEI